MTLSKSGCLFPECWHSCGNCGQNGITVDDIPLLVGDWVERDQTILVLETGKVALDIPAPAAGDVVGILVEVGDIVTERALILLLEIRT